MKTKILFLFCGLLTISNLISQVEVAPKQYEEYKRLPQENIYVHFNTNFLLVGESLFYKVYCLNKQTKKMSNLSKIAYVELLDKDLKSVYKDKIKIKNGVGQGDFFISKNLASGNYKLIAYTNWMKNKNEFYNENIYLINPYSQKLVSANKGINELIKSNIEVLDNSNTISLNKQTFKKREEVVVNAKKLNDLGGSYSISVRKKSLDFFRKKSTAKKYITSNETSNIKYLTKNLKINELVLPDFRGQLIIGNVHNEKTNKGVENKIVGLSFIGKKGFYKTAVTNQKGVFYFNVDEEQYPSKGFIQLLDANTENTKSKIEIMKNKDLDFSELKFNEIKTNDVLDSIIDQRSVYTQIENTFSEKKQDSILQGKSTQQLYLEDFKVYKLDDFNRFKTLKETIIEVLDVVSFKKKEDQYIFKIEREKLNYVYIYAPLVVIDGYIVKHHGDIINYEAKGIDEILVSQKIYQFSGGFYGGIIYIKTFNGDFKPKINQDVFQLEMEPLELEKNYYNGGSNIANKRIPDYRIQLLWNANLNIDSKELSFYTSDIKGVYEIDIQGYTQQGKPISIQKEFTVE